ncbi:MAG: PilZ domain-containing protein [Vicinamibacterales bacterium]
MEERKWTEDGGRANRRFERVPGPFDGCRVGKLDVAVRVYDLSVGGCFVNSTVGHRVGTRLVLKIDLPVEGEITVNAEVRNLRSEIGFGVSFTDVDADTTQRLIRTVAALKEP